MFVIVYRFSMSNVCIIFVMTINSIRNESSKNCLIEITGCSSLRFWQRNRYGCQTSAHFRRNYQTLSDLTRPLCSFSFSDFSYQLIQLDQLIDTSDKELTSKCKTKIQSVSFLHFSCKQIFYCLHICLQSAHFFVHIFILQNLDTSKGLAKNLFWSCTAWVNLCLSVTLISEKSLDSKRIASPTMFFFR